MGNVKEQSLIRFEAKVADVGTWNIVMLPQVASAKLPSRGMVMVQGTLRIKKRRVAPGSLNTRKSTTFWATPVLDGQSVVQAA